MANEATSILLLGDGGDPVRYTCASNVAITKGEILYLVGDNLVSGGTLATKTYADTRKNVAGIAAADKTSIDGATTISVYTNGVFDMIASGVIAAGNRVSAASHNYVISTIAVESISSSSIGVALETASDKEVIAVKVRI